MAAVETLRVVHLDAGNRVLGAACYPGDRDGVTVPLRAIVGDALANDASALLLSHDHPSGDPTPSTADLRATERLRAVAAALGIRLLDHIVEGGGRSVSFRALGLL